MDNIVMTVNELLHSVGVSSTAWDLLIVCDGAGQAWNSGAGWAAAMVDRQGGWRKILNGGVSNGTVNWAEAEAALHCLRYDLYHMHSGKLKAQRRVLIFSDSMVTVQTGNGLYSPRHNNPDIWHTYQWFRDQGYTFFFYHQPRNSNPLHVAMDALSKQGRTIQTGVEWIEEQIYDLLPIGPPVASQSTPSEIRYAPPTPPVPATL